MYEDDRYRDKTDTLMKSEDNDDDDAGTSDRSIIRLVGVTGRMRVRRCVGQLDSTRVKLCEVEQFYILNIY